MTVQIARADESEAFTLLAVIVHILGGTLVLFDADVAALPPKWTLTRTDDLDGRSVIFRLR